MRHVACPRFVFISETDMETKMKTQNSVASWRPYYAFWIMILTKEMKSIVKNKLTHA